MQIEVFNSPTKKKVRRTEALRTNGGNRGCVIIKYDITASFARENFDF